MVSSNGRSAKDICRQAGSPLQPVADDDIVAVGRSFETGAPLNGLRHPPENGTCGWYIWSGETLSANADFFQPLHVVHLTDIRREVLPYLALAPGWRFLIADGYEDLWYDENLLNV